MKSKVVDGNITTNEGLVRLRIFDGVIPMEHGAAELLEIERAQRDAERQERERERDGLRSVIAQLQAELVAKPKSI